MTRLHLRVWGGGLGSLRLWLRRHVHGGGGRLGKKRCPCHLWLCFCSLWGVSEGDTEAGSLTGVILAPGALGCGQGGGPLSAPISWQLFRNVCLPVLGLRVFPVGSFIVAGTI